MNEKALREFLIEAAKRGYGVGEWKQNEDKSYTIVFEQDQWKMHDNWFGGEPFGGRTIIFFDNKPVWIMAYYGEVMPTANDKKAVLQILRQALLNPPYDHPYRGPQHLTEGGLEYINTWTGDIKSYKGREIIRENGIEAYWAEYLGGYIDLRADE